MSLLKTLSILSVVALLAACSDTGGTGAASDDPYEGFNRKVHAVNKALDTAVVRPASNAYGTVVPEYPRTSISNFASNASLPGKFFNHVLQGDAADAGETFFRFAMNSTLGLGGLRDPAADAGLFARDTDFGETLALWGVPEGAYIELIALGPSSERDLAGKVVDFAIDPVGNIVEGDAQTAYYGVRIVDLINQRYEFRTVIDALLYQSADSYTAQRIAYLQNKAAQLTDGPNLEELEDPFAFDN